MQKMDNKLNAKVGEVKAGVDANSAAITNLGNQKANLTALSDTAYKSAVILPAKLI